MKYYHNPRCSKSRLGLEFLAERGIEPEVIEYLKTGVSVSDFVALSKKTGLAPMDGLIRVKEAAFKELGLSKNDERSVEEWAAFVEKEPKLLERPILVSGSKAEIGRPTENFEKLI